MKTIIGKKGLKYTWQKKFPKTTRCCKCGTKALIAFVAYENGEEECVCHLTHTDKEYSNGFWLHDVCAVAVYFCPKCLEPTALYNQA